MYQILIPFIFNDQFDTKEGNLKQTKPPTIEKEESFTIKLLKVNHLYILPNKKRNN
jgi:hypothetical protein